MTAAQSSGSDESFGYDANGNRNTDGDVTGADNEQTAENGVTYTYDHDGNRIGQLNADGTSEVFVWDYRNRLNEVQFKDASGTLTKLVDYTYDVDNRRIGEKVNLEDGTAAQNTRWVYDGDNVALQFSGAGGDQLTHRYLQGPAVDQLLVDEQVSSTSTPGTRYFTLADNLGSIRDLADDAGIVQKHVAFTAFGGVVYDVEISFSADAAHTVAYRRRSRPLQWSHSTAPC